LATKEPTVEQILSTAKTPNHHETIGMVGQLSSLADRFARTDGSAVN